MFAAELSFDLSSSWEQEGFRICEAVQAAQALAVFCLDDSRVEMTRGEDLGGEGECRFEIPLRLGQSPGIGLGGAQVVGHDDGHGVPLTIEVSIPIEGLSEK